MKWILASAVFVCATSASTAVFASGEKTSMTMEYASESYIVPTTGTSCSGSVGDLAAPMFAIRPLFITNNTDENLYLMAIKVTIPDGKSSYACIISGDELTATGLSRSLPGHGKTSVSCPVKCGGVRLSQAAIYSAKLEVLAVREHGNGAATPEKVEGPISIVNPKL